MAATSKQAGSGLAGAESGSKQSIEQLTQRYQQLNTKRIQAETNLENAKKQLTALQNEAREKYGTDDIAELQQKLETMKTENETKRGQYQDDLDRIERELTAVDEKFAAGSGEGGRA